MFPTVADRLRPRAISALSRRNFRYEFISVAFMAAGLACVDVNVLGVIADKAFHASAWVIALIAASDAMANVTSLFWTRFLYGTDRVRSANILQFCTIACVVGIAAAPYTSAGVVMLVALTLLARIFMTGIINARTDLWRANYPRDARARVIARFTTIGTFVIASTGLIIAVSMDLTPEQLGRAGLAALDGHEYRAVYIFAAITACVGARSFSRVRWRGRVAQIRAERSQRGIDGRHAASARAMIRILREDREYRRFMIAQFVLGAPNLAAAPIFILALRDHFTLGYTPSILLTRVIPIVMPVLVVSAWGYLLDRMHIVRFRSYHSWVFVVANTMMAFAFFWNSLPLLFLSRAVLGVAFGGGLLAWELGHHDFAKRDEAAIYMGVHVTLTGIRGVIAPFIGTLLYQGMSMNWLGDGAAIPAMGPWTFLIVAGISTIGALMFVKLYIDTRLATRHSPLRD